MRPRDFLEVLANPDLPRCTLGGEHAELLRSLLVHLFFADLDFDKREFALLLRVLPDIDAREYVKSVAARRLDLARLAELFPNQDDRHDIVTLVEHAAWSDAKLDRAESSLRQRLIEVLEVERE